MNDLQLWNYYLSIPLATPSKHSWIYPDFVKITGRSICYPHPHKHLNFEEFLDVIDEFKSKLKVKGGNQTEKVQFSPYFFQLLFVGFKYSIKGLICFPAANEFTTPLKKSVSPIIIF